MGVEHLLFQVARVFSRIYLLRYANCTHYNRVYQADIIRHQLTFWVGRVELMVREALT